MRSLSSRIGALVLLVAFLSQITIPVARGNVTDTEVISYVNDLSLKRWIDIEHGASWNATTKDLRLNWGSGILPSYEDLTSYTEVDGLSKIVVDSSRQVTFQNGNWRYNTNSYLYKNKAGSLHTFTLRYAMYMDQIDNNAASYRGVAGFCTNNLGNAVQSYAVNSVMCMIYGTTSTTAWALGAFGTHLGGSGFDAGTVTGWLNIDTWYYIKCVKVGTSWGIYVYSDSGYSTLVSNAALTLASDYSLTYYEVASNLGFASSINAHWIIKDVFFGYYGGYVSPGTIYTTNLGENVTGGSRVYEVWANCTTPAGSTLNIDISEDNVTWVSNSLQYPAICSNVQYGRYLFNQNYTTLYLRIRFTSTGLVTPTVNNLAVQLVSPAPPIPEPEGLDLMYLLAAVVCVGLGALATRARKPG